MPVENITRKALQRFWRMSRALTMGAQGAVIDADGRFLLIRHTYRPGWHFPGGGVEKNETAETALMRELKEEAGVTIDSRPELFGIYANFRYFPSDHITLYIVRNWHQPVVPKPNAEIAEQGMFAAQALPEGIHPPTQRRIVEIVEGLAAAEMW